jgi:hypothetical protein
MRIGPVRVTRRDLRLVSGLVMFTYIAAHLVDHAVGLWSIPAAEAGLAAAVRVWHSVPGTLLLYGAAALHVGLALVAIYERRTLRMPPLDFVRILLGLGTPILLRARRSATRDQPYGVWCGGTCADAARFSGGNTKKLRTMPPSIIAIRNTVPPAMIDR